jgi:hypothetical protein
MALNAANVPAAGGKDRVEQAPLEVGNYPGRVVQVIDYGMQPQRPYQGEDKPPAYEIGLTYELVDTFMLDAEGNEVEDKPRWVSENFVLRNIKADLAKSTKRMNALDPEGALNGDFTQVLTFPINVMIGQNKKGDKVYTNVLGLSAMRPRDAANCPALKNPTKLFDLSDPDIEVFKSFPQWIQDKIRGNLEYKGSLLEQRLGIDNVEDKPKDKPAPKKPAKAAPEEVDPDDDIPY